MKNGKLIAVSALSTALSIVFLVIGVYFHTFDLSALFTASLMVMIPLSKKSYKGALLTYISTAILAFVFSMGRFHVPLLYAVFFGVHPIVNYFQMQKGSKFWFLYIVKCVWFIGVCFLMFYAFAMFTDIPHLDSPFIKNILPLIIVLLGLVFYILYDLIMIKFQKMSFMIVKRLGL